ncbi:uncharacterized protein F5891DRAFT_1189123 [Suillus fuscotomentosus]|uniref:Uncharacterized protein n=1 Tax=Suillus fuscotomentosus TaxID=1912939 RepID=A0AAD4E631_9AGAM|nr:uncharacterized protein F5891DRAFT_1189123 [Suillus fuscotomentosus]KAG1900032.1 hypothetical protein F5891DRAFT_1189123 [Suillus fuscotomentosus]
MSKRAASGGDEPPPKHHCTLQGNQALCDNGAWDILEKFLTTSMLFSEMNDALEAYLGDRYSEDDWVEPRRLLFSGDADNAESLKNLRVIRKMYILDSPAKSSMGIPGSRAVGRLPKSQIHKSRRLSKAAYKFILHEAEEDDEDEEEEEEVGEVGLSVQSPKATHCLVT